MRHKDLGGLTDATRRYRDIVANLEPAPADGEGEAEPGDFLTALHRGLRTLRRDLGAGDLAAAKARVEALEAAIAERLRQPPVPPPPAPTAPVDQVPAMLAAMSAKIGEQLHTLISRQETMGRFLQQALHPPAAAPAATAAPTSAPKEPAPPPRPLRPRPQAQPVEGDEMDRKMQEAMAQITQIIKPGPAGGGGETKG